MKVIETLFKFSHSFPAISISTESAKILNEIAPEVNPKKYSTMSFVFAFGAALIGAIIGYIVLSDVYSVLLIATALFSLFGFLLLKIPEIELNRQKEEFERELPAALRILGMLIDFGVPFQKALEFIAEENSVLGREMRKITSDANLGIALSRSLSHLASRTKSQPIKRAIAQIIACYRHGPNGKEIKAVSDELLALQQHKFRDAAVRSSTLGLLFIAVAALFPTFFMIIAMLGSTLISTTISEQSFILVLLLLFPSISLLVLLIAKASLPGTLFRTEQKSDLSFVILTFFLILLVLLLPLPYNYVLLGLGFIGMGFFLYKKYKQEKRREDIDAILPDALFSISTLPKASSVEKLLSTIASGGFGPLSDEAAISCDQLAAGIKTELVLRDIRKRNESETVSRAFQMIEYAVNTNSLDRLADVAENMLKFSEIARERTAILSMQKYTLIFGGLLIPLILKITISLLMGMKDLLDSSALALLPVAIKTSPVYTMIYGMLVSYYVSEIEEKESLFAIYFILLTAAGLIIFSIVSI